MRFRRATTWRYCRAYSLPATSGRSSCRMRWCSRRWRPSWRLPAAWSCTRPWSECHARRPSADSGPDPQGTAGGAERSPQPHESAGAADSAGVDLRIRGHLRPQSCHLRGAGSGPHGGLAPAARGFGRFRRVRARRQLATCDRYRLLDRRAARAADRANRPAIRTAPVVREKRRHTADRRWPKFEHGGHGHGLRRQHRSAIQFQLGSRPWHRGTAGADRYSCLVQPESRDSLVHDSGNDRHLDPDPDPDAHGHVGRARARARHFRSAAGDAVSPLRDHGRQSAAFHGGGHDPGHRSAAGRSALVPHSLCRLLLGAVPGTAVISAGGGGHRTAGLRGGRDHAAGNAVFHAADHALLAAFGADHTAQQHAGRRAIFDGDQPAALRDRYHEARVSRGRGAGLIDRRPLAPGPARLPHPGGRIVDVQPPHAMIAMNRTRKVALSAVFTLIVTLLASCTVGPNFVRPTPAVPPHWSARATSTVTEQSADFRAWWSAFDESMLTSLIERAASSNLDLRSAMLRIDEARAQRAISAAAYWPTLSVDAAFSRQRLSETTPTGSLFSSVGKLPLPGGTSISIPNPYDQYQLSANASWEIDLFGRVRRSVEAADANVQVSVEDQHSVLISVLADVAQSYLELRGAQARLHTAKESLATIEELLDLTRQRRAAGMTTYIDVSNSAAQATATRAQLPAFELQITGSINL